MIGLDLLDVVQHKILIVLAIDLERLQIADHMIHIDQAGLGQPQRGLLFAQDEVEHQHQESIALNGEIIYENLLVERLDDAACFRHGFLIEILCVKHFHVEAESADAVVPDLR